MTDMYRKFDGLTYREIGWRLRRTHLPEEMIEQQIREVREYRKARTAAKAQRRTRERLWGEVISSLQHERKIVRSMLRYKTKEPAPERDDFIAAYMQVLDTLYEKLQAKKRLSPAVPEHSHWTDYVPARIKDAFKDEAGIVPPRQKARFKEPFKRADPIRLRNLRHGRLMRYIRNTLDTTLMRLDANPEDARAVRQEYLLRKAYDRAKALPLDAHVPNHWADLVADELGQTDE